MAEFEPFSAPADLTTVTDEALAQMEVDGVAEFDRVHEIEDYTPDEVAYAITLRDDLDRVKAELSARKVRNETAAAQAKAKAAKTMSDLKEAVHGPAEGTPEATVQAARMDSAREDAIAAAAARGVTAGLVQVLGDRAGGRDLASASQRAVASLSNTARQAPAPNLPKAKLAITASANGQDIDSISALAKEFIEKAQSIPTSAVGRTAARYPVARIRNDFKHTVDERTNPATIEEMYRDLVNKDSQQALVAGGGWCAPSELLYDFFNIADADGAIDLPTMGVTRGGIKFPVSPAIGDVFFQSAGSNPASGFGGFAFAFSNASDPWLWTETDDILTVTGSVNKPTLRVPCPSFSEVRLEAYGLTVTAGNLTDSAYPEATQNFIRLLRSAYAHAINARLIGLMVAASSSSIASGAANNAAANSLLDGVELAATDYRARYAMGTTAVLEVVLPYWIKAVIRADLAWRQGVDMISVGDAQITAYFGDRNVAVQFVNDWQVRGASQFGQATASALTAWPTTAQFMIYAAGTFVHGTGMSLDLGVVRDSVLNAENDFTAAWAEESHLIAKVGHESRLYTSTFSVNGAPSAGGALGPRV